METEEIISIIVLGTFLVFLFCVAIVLFVLYYMKSKKLHHQQLHIQVLKTELDSIDKTSVMISGELHDNIAQHLSAACILLQEKNLVNNQLEVIHQIVDSSLEKLKNISHSLTAHHVENISLPSAIKREIAVYENLTKVNIEFKCEMEGIPVSKEKQLMLLRICQEGVNNAVKHSDATHIIIRLQKDANKFFLSIKDNGKGFESQKMLKTSNGLINMQQRADYISAEFSVVSKPTEGTEVRVVFDEQ